MAGNHEHGDEFIGTPRMALYFAVTTQTILRWGRDTSRVLSDVETIRNGGQKVKGYRAKHVAEAARNLEYGPADVDRVCSRVAADSGAPAPFKNKALELLAEYKRALNGQTGVTPE